MEKLESNIGFIKTMKWIRELLALLKKEFITLITAPESYIVAVVFLIILEFLYFSSLLNINVVYIQPLLDNIPWMFIFLIPAVTMSSLSQERREGTLEQLSSQPISEVQIVTSKFLSRYFLIIFTTLLTLPAVISVASYGHIDWGQTIGQYFAIFILALPLCALGICFSGIVENQIGAFLLSLIVSFFITIIGFDIVTRNLPPSVSALIEKFSLYSHYAGLSRGVIDARDIIYFSAVTILFLFICYTLFIRTKFGKGSRNGIYLKTATIIISGICIVCAILGDRIPGRIDLTSKKLYTLSDATKEIITRNTENINITVYLSEQLPAQFQPTLRAVKDTLRDYSTYGKGKVSVSYKYTDDTKIASEAQSKGITPVQFNVKNNQTLEVKTGYLGIHISYKESSEIISFVEETENLEYQLTSLISKLTNESKKKLVFLSSYSKNQQSMNYQTLSKELRAQFEITNWSPDDENPDLPDGTSLLVLTGVNSDIPEKVVTKIKDYVENGGAILAMIDSLETQAQTLSVTVNEKSFSKFFAEYGITVEDRLLYDLKYNEVVTVGDANGRGYLINYPFWIKSIPTEEIQNITQGVESVGLRWASPISINSEARTNASIQPVLTTSEYASSQESSSFNIAPGNNSLGSGVTLEKNVVAVSYLEPIINDKNIRMIVIGDSDFMTDDEIGSSGSGIQFAINSIEWLTQEVSLASIREKDSSLSPLVFSRGKYESTLLQYGNIIGVSVIISLTGGIIIWRRKKLGEKVFA